jgi:hypothetical protein
VDSASESGSGALPFRLHFIILANRATYLTVMVQNPRPIPHPTIDTQIFRPASAAPKIFGHVPQRTKRPLLENNEQSAKANNACTNNASA